MDSVAADARTRPRSNWRVWWRRWPRVRWRQWRRRWGPRTKNFFVTTGKTLGVIGAVAIALTTALGTWATYRSSERSARTAEQGLVTERFKDGVDELGVRDENVRAGGIYTLVQVAKEALSSKPHADTRTADAAYAIILSFVRVNLCQNKNPDDPGATPFVGPPQSVITALQVLHDDQRKIDLRHLRGCDGSDLYGVDLTNADLTGAHLTGVTFEAAKLNGVNFHCANLYTTNFTHDADVSGAHFDGADITNDGFENARELKEVQLRTAYWDMTNPKYLPSVNPDKQGLIRLGPSPTAVTAHKACKNF